jgi:hypothetical protein
VNNLSTLIDLLKAAQGAIKLSTGDEAHNYIQAVIDELQHSGTVSEGYVLVPVKPTAAITKALKADFPLSTQGVRLIYSLIIKAAQEQQHEM